MLLSRISKEKNHPVWSACLQINRAFIMLKELVSHPSFTVMIAVTRNHSTPSHIRIF
jgi:hypothetical protein